MGERPMLDWTPARSIEDMDRAGVALSVAMKPLANFVSAKKILFGTDFPFRTASDHVKGLTWEVRF
jgi:hypothetical protein